MMRTGELYQGLLRGTGRKAGPENLFARWSGGQSPADVMRNSALAPLVERLEKDAAAFTRTEITALPFSLYRLFDESGGRLAYEGRYFERRRRLVTLALACWFWKKEEHITALEDTIWAICDEYSWCLPAHMEGMSLQAGDSADGEDIRRHVDLFAAETGFALAECLAMTGALLRRAAAARAREEIFHRVINSYTGRGKPQRWEMMDNNWCAVCAGGVAGAALYLVKDDLLLAGILGRLAPTFERFLASFSSDGACMEGLSYWTYGVGFYAVFADLLFHRTAGAIDLLGEPGFGEIARFQQRCYFPGGAALNFSDAGDDGNFRPGLSRYLADRIPGVTPPVPRRLLDPAAPGKAALAGYGDFIDHCGRFCLALRDLLWMGDTLPVPAERNRVDVLPGAQWLLCSGAGETGFAAKGGHNDESHNHNDVGSFIFYKNGAMFLLDIGAGEYTRDYFGSGRYAIFCNRSEGHNLPVIDGRGQRPGRKSRARNCALDADGTMSLDIAPAYAVSGLERLERNFHFDVSTGVLTLRDRFLFSGKALPCTERFILPAMPRLEPGRFSLAVNGADCSLVCSEKITPLAAEARYRDHQGRDALVYTVDFSFLPSSNFEVEFVIR